MALWHSTNILLSRPASPTPISITNNAVDIVRALDDVIEVSRWTTLILRESLRTSMVLPEHLDPTYHVVHLPQMGSGGAQNMIHTPKQSKPMLILNLWNSHGRHGKLNAE
jgi:hypothetical protein